MHRSGLSSSLSFASTSLADDLLAENDLDLPVGGLAGDGLESRLLWSRGVDPFHVILEFRHEEEQADDHDRPQQEHDQQEQLIRGHRP